MVRRYSVIKVHLWKQVAVSFQINDKDKLIQRSWGRESFLFPPSPCRYLQSPGGELSRGWGTLLHIVEWRAGEKEPSGSWESTDLGKKWSLGKEDWDKEWYRIMERSWEEWSWEEWSWEEREESKRRKKLGKRMGRQEGCTWPGTVEMNSVAIYLWMYQSNVSAVGFWITCALSHLHQFDWFQVFRGPSAKSTPS